MSILIFLDPFIDYKVLRYSCDLIHMRDVNMNVSQMVGGAHSGRQDAGSEGSL